ncbi:MAG: 5'-deoxynucleotidase [Hydrogenoanaerobacterium sp.]
MKKNSFFALLARTKYISRWGLMRSLRQENLAEHSLEVAQLAHALALLGNRRLGKSYDIGRVVLCAMYHDASEIITGDLPTPIKYYSEGLKENYKALEKTALQSIKSGLPDDLQEDYDEVLCCKDTEILAIVKAADKLSALIKCVEEERGGNREFATARASTEKAIAQMHLPEAEIFLKEFFPAYNFTLDELK